MFNYDIYQALWDMRFPYVIPSMLKRPITSLWQDAMLRYTNSWIVSMENAGNGGSFEVGPHDLGRLHFLDKSHIFGFLRYISGVLTECNLGTMLAA